MKRKIEDILSGESPRKDLDNESVNETKKMGGHILKTLQRVKADTLTADAHRVLWERIEGTTKKTEQRNKRIRIWKYSSVASILIAFSFWIWNKGESHISYDTLLRTAMNSENLIEQYEEVSIQGGDGFQLRIADGQQLIDLRSKEGYGNKTKENQPTFNTLTVPYGKRIEVILPDSSQVWLNAGSQLTFPTVFDKGERQVYLEGEGYFDVMGDVQRPFYVHTANMTIKVLGTTFNISSYKDDPFASTVLLSGEIELQGTGAASFDAQTLKPGTAAILHKDSKRLSISEETVENYISWTRRQLVLKNTPLTEILARLERVYNTDIVLETGVEINETFSGRLDLTQPLTSLLTTLYNPLEYQLQKEERRVRITRK